MSKANSHGEGLVINQPLRDKARARAAAKTADRKLIAIPGSWRRKAERTASLLESFFHAFRGFAHAFETERNMRIHVLVASSVAIAAFALRVDTMGWAMLTLACGIVITAELVNTALERLVDIATNNEFHRIARDTKDTAAAAVLCTAVVAAIIGMLVFVPRVMALLGPKL
jgi:diacylglycerol kinase